VTLNPDVAVGLAGQSNNPNGHPAVLAAVQKAIDQVNAQHARVANIRKFTVLDSPLSIERGELTATLKVRRHNVIKRHEEKVKAMYDS
jgi:long-chain acyl-CoA synthetase